MVYLMILVSLFIGSPTVAEAYTIFSKGKFPMASQYFHPQLDKIDPDIFIATVQEGEYLKAVTYRYDKEKDTYRKFMGPYYFPNPQKRDFSRMPVRYVRGEGCFLFSDGTRLYPKRPSDTHTIGTSEKRYNVRWRRVYKNYYLITLFRSRGNAVQEDLMTAKDGMDLTPILGETSKEPPHKKYYGSVGSIEKHINAYINVDGKEQCLESCIIVVDENELPPDFPKGLVRWFP